MSEQDKPKAVVGGNNSSGLGSEAKRRLIKIAAVIVVIGAVVGVIAYRTVQAPKNEKKAYQHMITAESKARSRDQPDAAKKLLTDFLAKYPKNKDNAQLSRIYIELSAIYSTAGDNKTAQMWQTKALSVASNVTYADYFNLAEVCLRSGDKACAISNYKKTLDRMNQNDKPQFGPLSPPLELYIKNQLKKLGA
ncbi:MAG TPA: tetratricopeptide repeat protein [Patescibacteria group bacterium]|nr:tetratricopeptide repeat protein [Patescibacteria group bacterium]